LTKTFVLDTNVLLFDPQSILKFADNKVFIPLIVVEELDRFKRDQNENGRNARHFSRLVDSLREKGSLAKGVTLANGGELIIKSVEGSGDFDYSQFGIDMSLNDNLILRDALALKSSGEEVTVISKDINLRLKGDALGIESKDYESSDVSVDDLYTGQRTLNFSSEKVEEFAERKFIETTVDLFPNEYVFLSSDDGQRKQKLGRYSHGKKGVVPLILKREGIWGIHPRNQEQQFAFDALLNDEVKLVSLVGKAGTGKTLLAIAAGLEATINQQTFSRVLVSRPIIPMGRDLGFLPGDINEKLGPWMQPIFDNIDFLFDNKRGERDRTSWEELINQGLLHVEPLTYIRGRSLPGQYMIVDEAQNLSPHEIKTIITRAGEGTKIILTGDCDQIDSPYLDSINNGLTYCIERLKYEPIVSHVFLQNGERSELSEIASQKL
jgi:PhoH-like ATPase